MARDSLIGSDFSPSDDDVDVNHREGRTNDHDGVDGNESQPPQQNQTNDASQSNQNNTQAGEEEEEGNLLFSCQCDSARTIATLLSCLRRVVTASTGGGSSWSSSGGGGGSNTQTQRGGTQSMAVSGASANKIQHATVYAGPNGLTFHVQHGLAKQSQCSVDMPKGLFREYFVGEEEVWLEDSDDDEEEEEDDGEGRQSQSQRGTKEVIQGGEFGVNLTTVLECFSILSKTGNKPSSSGGGADAGGKAHLGEYSSLSNVPLCMSYDRGTATFHLEFLEGGSISNAGDAAAAANLGGGGCLVTCEVPGVAVADDVDDGPDEDDETANNQQGLNANNNSGLASAFRSSPLLSRAILYSDALQAAVAELYDVPGASIVQISLCKTGMELGTVGPRSEVWVNVPYHRGQGGMYVGLECYKPNVPLFGSLAASSGDGTNIVRKYPLGAFLSGMRGLDIGVETCISVNARGMMAIQHQVSRDGYYDYSEDGDRGNVRPSFVDFIMTSMEDVEEDNDGDGDAMAAMDNASVQLSQHGGLQDITNTGSTDDVDTVSASRKVAAKSRGRSRAKVAAREEQSSSEEEEGGRRPAHKVGRKGQRKRDANEAKADHDFGAASGDVDFDDNQHDVEYQNADADDANTNEPASRAASRNNAAEASRILGELEMDKDMLASHNRAETGRGRTNALEDIRRRRQEQQMRRQSRSEENQMQNDGDQQESDNGSGSDDGQNHHGKGGASNGSKRRSKRSRRNEGEDGDNSDSNPSDDDEDNQQTQQSKRQHSHSAQDSQSQSEEDDDDSDGDETENENSLDVTADIPLLFSKRSSLSTSRHGRGSRGRRSSSRGKNGTSGDSGEEEEEHDEPRMMYGDTALEFTQDGYDSD